MKSQNDKNLFLLMAENNSTSFHWFAFIPFGFWSFFVFFLSVLIAFGFQVETMIFGLLVVLFSIEK